MIVTVDIDKAENLPVETQLRYLDRFAVVESVDGDEISLVKYRRPRNSDFKKKKTRDQKPRKNGTIKAKLKPLYLEDLVATAAFAENRDTQDVAKDGLLPILSSLADGKLILVNLNNIDTVK